MDRLCCGLEVDPSIGREPELVATEGALDRDGITEAVLCRQATEFADDRPKRRAPRRRWVAVPQDVGNLLRGEGGAALGHQQREGQPSLPTWKGALRHDHLASFECHVAREVDAQRCRGSRQSSSNVRPTSATYYPGAGSNPGPEGGAT